MLEWILIAVDGNGIDLPHDLICFWCDPTLSIPSSSTTSASISSPEALSDGSSPRIVVVIPAYYAEQTLPYVLRDLPPHTSEEVIVVDDCSADDTAGVAKQFGVSVIRHDIRRGYGGAQKTGYQAALENGADVVVMVHGDYQYDPRLVSIAGALISLGVCDVVLGNRVRTRREALAGGMPLLKYLANRSLSLTENVLCGQNLGEWHSGFRAFSARVLETIPWKHNSDGFVCDSQMLVQCVHFGFRIGDIPMPVRYFDEAGQIAFGEAAKYSLGTLAVIGQWYLHRWKIKCSPLFQAPVTEEIT